MSTSISRHLESILREHLDKDSFRHCNGLVSIWYHRLQKGTSTLEHVEHSHFESTDDLIRAILYSTSIPGITSWVKQDPEYYYFDGISVPEHTPRSDTISLVSECTSLWDLFRPSALWEEYPSRPNRLISSIPIGSTIRITPPSRFMTVGYSLCRYYYRALAWLLYLMHLI
jgi:hypothetical protein